MSPTNFQMKKLQRRMIFLIIVSVIILGFIAFSCSLIAEFKKSKGKEIKLDGSLCCMHRSPAFGLGITAIVCLSIAQIVGSSVAAADLCMKDGCSLGRRKSLSIVLLILSWISYGMGVIILGTGTSMSDKQHYGNGWMNGQCYVVKDGMFIGSSVLVVAAVTFIVGFMYTVNRNR